MGGGVGAKEREREKEQKQNPICSQLHNKMDMEKIHVKDGCVGLELAKPIHSSRVRIPSRTIYGGFELFFF
jgi:hypothetical protein